MKKRILAIVSSLAAAILVTGIMIWCCSQQPAGESGKEVTVTPVPTELQPSPTASAAPTAAPAPIATEYAEPSASATPTAGKSTATPKRTTPATPQPIASKPAVGLFCTLDILGSRIQVYNTVSEASLKKRPGWLPSSAVPGQEGVAVIYGHRNRRHFRVLENIEIGDRIELEIADGSSIAYVVRENDIFEATDDLRIPARGGKWLALITCYPFRYSGSAPGKFVCWCEQV